MRIILLFSFLTLALFFVGCKCDDPRDPECDNYDPCIDAVELTGEIEAYHFRRYETPLGLRDSFYVKVDTLVDEFKVQFRAVDMADNYRWRIGDDPREWETREVVIDFEGFSGDIEVHLEAWNDAENQSASCTVINDSLTTRTKIYRLEDVPSINDNDEGPQAYFGEYLGYYNDDPSEEYRIYIKDGYADSGLGGVSQFNWGGIYDFPRGCDHTTRAEGGRGLYAIWPLWNSFVLSDFSYPWNYCTGMGIGRYDAKTESIHIEYWYYSLEDENYGDSIGLTFTATKI